MCSDEKDSFENSFYQYVDFLRTLASPPQLASEMRGNFNVAGELWLEVDHGLALVEYSEHPFSQAQVDGICELISQVKGVVPEASSYVETRSECVAQLSHPSWSHPRQLAAQLLEAMSEAISTNQAYIDSEKPWE